MTFNVSLTCPTADMNYPIDGVETIALVGRRYFLISVENVGWKLVTELSFDSSGNFSTTFNIEGRVFILELGLQSIQPYFQFTPVLLEDTCSFEMDESFVKSFFPNNGGSLSGGFSVPSLNGNCGSLPDGSIVTVTGLDGDFNVVASQFVWNDSTAQMSMIMYNLSKDEKFCLVPDVYVSAKAS